MSRIEKLEARKIKFRLWSKVAEVMIFWEQVKEKPHCIWDEVNYKTMQFTGIHDINGVEIYEGDICRTDASCFHHLKGVDFKVRPVSFETGKFNIEGLCIGMLVNDFDCEVIGNIQENPELLEAKR